MSLYWIFRRGLRSSLVMFWASPVRYWTNISLSRSQYRLHNESKTKTSGPTVAKVMTKAALLEQTVISGSTAMIFLTRVTGGELVAG